MATQLTPEQLRAIFTGTSLSLAYRESVRLYERLNVHASAGIPVWLIRDARPNESDEVRKYRTQIYEPETQNPIERVLGVLKKIRRSPDWMIRYDSDPPAIINKDEVLKKYLSENYPQYKDFENWLFEEALRVIALDANAVVAIIPESFDVPDTEYIRPVAQIFNSDKVLQYANEDYCVIKTDELSSLLSPLEQQQRLANTSAMQSAATNMNLGSSKNYNYSNGYDESFYQGQVYYHIDTMNYIKWEENKEGKFQITRVYPHNLGELPVFQMPGEFAKRYGQAVLKKTLLNPMLPHLNKAARESNDLDAGVVKHLHLKEWEINNTDCKKCNGTGSIPSASSPDGKTDCPKCLGSGMATGNSPFDKIRIKPPSITNPTGQIPIPPMGYVDLNPEIIKIANDRIERHIYRALESVNMEHLSDVQMNESGISKEFDRDEANAIVYSFATFLCFVANAAIYYIAKLRYNRVVTDRDTFMSILPVVPVPEKFDVINTTFLLQEYQSAKTAGVNSTILRELQKELADKKFYANPKVADFVKTVMEVDPFPDKTIEEKALLEGQGLVDKVDIVLSTYITDFVKQATEENDNFGGLSYKQKRDILLKYAKDKVKELSTANQVLTDVMQGASQASAGGADASQQSQPANSNGTGIKPTLQQQQLKNLGAQVATVNRLGNANV